MEMQPLTVVMSQVHCDRLTAIQSPINVHQLIIMVHSPGTINCLTVTPLHGTPQLKLRLPTSC